MTDHLVLEFFLRLVRERYNWFVTVLYFKITEIDTVPFDPRRSSGFESSCLYSELSQTLAQKSRRKDTVRSAFIRDLTYKYPAAKIGSSGNDNGLCLIYGKHPRKYAPFAVIVSVQFNYLSLSEIHTVLKFKFMLHDSGVFPSVYLSSQRMHGRTFAPVEHPHLKHALIGTLSHLSAQGIYFTHKMTLGRSAYRRIARTVSDRIHIYSKDTGATSKTRTCQGRLYSGVTGTYYNNIIFTSKICTHIPPIPNLII